MDTVKTFQRQLDELRENHLYRTLNILDSIPGNSTHVKLQGKEYILFCSNDYLGLSRHPLLKERAMEFLERYGAGSTASRLICGSYDCFEKVEKKLATLKGTTSSLIQNSGFQANVSILPALADGRTLILSDWLNHNSIVNGAMLSRCHVARFRHNDLAHLKMLLEENQHRGFSRTLIVTESVFSVDGDRCDMDGLIKLKEQFQAMLVVDEAHATGLWGERGMGLTCGKRAEFISQGAARNREINSRDMHDQVNRAASADVRLVVEPAASCDNDVVPLGLGTKRDSLAFHLESVMREHLTKGRVPNLISEFR